ncbi:MAG: hypothetical protein K2X71_18275 [Methylobacterium sp.]|uniref:hypothetical protein n=1 Tax=Methylobacterium sp. TaxID=409 RepID=UPI00258A5C85|nr:hypothetical protein [Methylobacterium sp.]MBY0297954.1 hypothetical protein [Methylobacterium sp.]
MIRRDAPRLGIGITTYDRPGRLAGTLDGVARPTVHAAPSEEGRRRFGRRHARVAARAAAAIHEAVSRRRCLRATSGVLLWPDRVRLP